MDFMTENLTELASYWSMQSVPLSGNILGALMPNANSKWCRTSIRRNLPALTAKVTYNSILLNGLDIFYNSG